jgi:hypothetical protein
MTPPLPPDDSRDDAVPGVPAFRTWPAVYWFVLACFAATVAALTGFTYWYR